MKKLKYLYSLAVIFLLFGCEDFLNKLPETSLSPEAHYTDEKKIEFGVNGVYSSLRKCYESKDYAYWKRDAWSDNIVPGTDYSDIEDVLTGKLNQYSSMADDLWAAYYATIVAANEVLHYADTENNLNNSTIKRCIGELLFIRSLLYIDLTMLYGDVPLILSPISVTESMSITRSTQEKVWKQIHDDLDRAILYLPINYSTKDNGRVTKGAAIALQARAYLYDKNNQNKWNNVLHYTNLILDNISSYNYNLYDDGTTESYYNLFLTPYNEEIIFSLQYANDSKNWNSMSNDKYMLQFDVNISLINEFENVDGKRVPVSHPDFSFFDKEPRFQAVMLHIGGNLNRTDTYYYLGSNTTYAVSTRIKKGCDYTLSNMKQDFNDQILLRFADLLLMKAEALNELGEHNQAISFIKQVRDRVNLPTSITANYENVKKAIMHERRVEFCFEGTRYFDIQRWDIGRDIYSGDVKVFDKNVMKAINSSTNPTGYVYQTMTALTYSFIPERNYLFPIPHKERLRNKNLSQNNGY